MIARLRRRVRRNGKKTTEIIYLISSLTLEELDAAGFLKLASGVEPLDNTFIHPESYAAARALLDMLPADASGKASNQELLGRPRTYARLPAGTAWSYASWIEAVRAGRTFVTLGPLLQGRSTLFGWSRCTTRQPHCLVVRGSTWTSSASAPRTAARES